MAEFATLDDFHFLRPWWLLVIPVAVWLYWRLRSAYSAADRWRRVIDPDLLRHLTVRGRHAKRVRPYQLGTLALVIASIAAAGPAWEREITPFTEDRAPLIIALELTPTMLATDQPPTRLERATQKIRDILQRRAGARTAVIAYAGSAHAVLPLTDDAALIETYLSSLTPGVMPREGDDAATALRLAATMLRSEQAEGTVLFITDGIDRTAAKSFGEHAARSKDQILILGIGTGQGGPIRQEGSSGSSYGLVNGAAPGIDLNGLEAVAEAAGTSLMRATVDDTDVERLRGSIRSNLVNAIRADEELQWRDSGYFLVWPFALIFALWARRGWTVQWV